MDHFVYGYVYLANCDKKIKMCNLATYGFSVVIKYMHILLYTYVHDHDRMMLL